MSKLVQCEHCGKMMSSQLSAKCPNCGGTNKNTGKMIAALLFIVAIIVFVSYWPLLMLL